MYFRHSDAIWQQFPMLVPGVLVLHQVSSEVDVEKQLVSWLGRAEERLSRASDSQMPEIAAWRRAYSQMGLKPTQYRSAAEALLRRFRRERKIPRVHPLIDLCNALSLAFAVPVAAFDVNRVKNHLEVRHARGDEEYLAFTEEIEAPAPGEVIFADAEGHAHARRWTFRQSLRSVVTPETRTVLIVAEALHHGAERDVSRLLKNVVGVASEHWSVPCHGVILSAKSPRWDFE